MIEVGGELAAGTIGFAFGRDPRTSTTPRSTVAWGVLAPGMVLVAEDIRLAIEAGSEGRSIC